MKKGYFSGEEEEEDGLVDLEQDDFLLDYHTRFNSSIMNFREEVRSINSMPKKKRLKHMKQLKSAQTNVQYLEEHENLLEQMLKHKDLIDVEKVENIRDDMDSFLVHPGNKILRDELMDEYHHIFRDIEEVLNLLFIIVFIL